MSVDRQAVKTKDIHRHTGTQVCLDDSLDHLLPWDIDLIIDDPVDKPEEEPEV